MRRLILLLALIALPAAALAQNQPPFGGLPVLHNQITVSGSGDLAVNLSQGGHLSSQLGNGTLPTVTTCGTGTVTPRSTDTAGQVTATGATACTVVFTTAFANAPICVATDNTTAAGLAIASATITTAHFIVSGLTSGDVFSYVCIGK